MSKKDINIEQAKMWCQAVEGSGVYNRAINKSIDKTEVRKRDLLSTSELNYVSYSVKYGTPIVEFAKNTTYDVLCEEYNDDSSICVLNFASFFLPGGGFLKGSYTQEESLCHVSGLYQVLRELPIYRERTSRANVPVEYNSEVIYSPSVPFTNKIGELSAPMYVDVVSCAAPNCNRVPISKMDKVKEAVKERLKACFIIPFLNGCDTIILGAWGCGAFRNDPTLVARTFKALTRQYGGLYKKIIYAIPNEEFLKIFSSEIKAE